MPSYATTADMRARKNERYLIELTDEAETGAIDQGRLTRALEQADNLIDGYVSRYYARADAAQPVPPLLTDLACDIALYRLFQNGSPTEQVESDYKRAIQTLKDIASGQIKLDLGVETLPERDGAILIEGPEGVMGRDNLGGF